MGSCFKARLLGAAALLTIAGPALADPAGSAPGASTVSAPNGQTTTARPAGQANDANSLTTSDIIVTGARETTQAPSISSLTTTQPQAAVSQDYIAKSAPVTSDFFQLALITPGVTLTGANNGFGLGESKLSIRGFQDGEYNVTYDSIPFADTNNPTHHTTAFFPSNTVETLVVDRGPGNASQLGQATYGGNINVYSRAARDEASVGGDMTFGSFRTVVGRVELQSGAIDKLGGAKFVVTGYVLDSHGALTYSPTHSKNIFAKGVIPIGASNTLTLVGTYNADVYYQSDAGSGTCGYTTTVNGLATTLGDITGNHCTTGAIATYGRYFGLTNDHSPTNKYAQDYYKYNETNKQTDFEYARLQSQIAPRLTLDNRVYMYGYTNHTLSGQDATGATANTVILTPGSKAVTGVPGYDKLNKYRVFGYIGEGDYTFGMGRLRLGGWYEHSDTDRHFIDYDFATGQPNYREGSAKGVTTQPPPNIRYSQGSGWNQFQLFGEVETRPFAGLSITPGVKYVHFERSIDAEVNQTSRTPINTSSTWKQTLPFATANYQVTSNWTSYFQFAKGIYVPDLSSFYSASSSLLTTLDALQPQTSTNYQFGTVYHGKRFAVDADIYKVDVNNKIASSTAAGADTSLLVNIGQVHYKGVEGQVSIFPVRGMTLFGNASYNKARNGATDQQIAKAPYSTEAVGVFYNAGPIFASFTQKFTGVQYATEAVAGAPFRLYRIKPYSIGDLAVGYDFGKLRLSLNVNNVFDNEQVNQIKNSGTGAPKTTIGGVSYQSGYGPNDQLLFNAPRTFQGTIGVKF